MAYIAKINYSAHKETIGNGQCVALVKELAGAPATVYWREGDKVSDLIKSNRIVEGTVIATFVRGRYPNKAHGNHAAIFLRAVSGGIEVFDQWRNHKPERRVIQFGHKATTSASNRPELYSVVE
jgi:hypothetical protein